MTMNRQSGSVSINVEKFDEKNTGFSCLRLWQDANLDGLSQAGELFTFAQLGGMRDAPKA